MVYSAYHIHEQERQLLLIFPSGIARDQGLERKELISILEKLKREEYTEVWGYELAKLYHKEGRKKECIRECNDLIVWFQNLKKNFLFMSIIL